MTTNDQTHTIDVPPGATVVVMQATADAVVTRADGTIKED